MFEKLLSEKKMVGWPDHVICICQEEDEDEYVDDSDEEEYEPASSSSKGGFFASYVPA